MLNEHQRIIYQIDGLDRISAVDDAWDKFAVSNGAPELSASNIISRSLWEFISDDMTRHIYKEMLVVVRSGKSVSFDFRCDSADCRRFLKMNVSRAVNAGVQFESSTAHTELRPAQEIFRKSLKFSDDLVLTCSWCNKFKTGEHAWHEVEQAIDKLHLFDLDPAPRLSHGICDRCREEMRANLHRP